MLSFDDLDASVQGFHLGWSGWAKLPGVPLFTKVWGSYSHNCAHDGSDLDMLAVYALPTRDVIGLEPVREDAVWMTANGAPFDLEAHEVGKFCRLILKGGPAALETLFTDRLYRSTMAFDALRAMADRFLSKRAVRQYLGYADGQLRKLANGRSLHTKGGKMSEKWSYHFSRLVADAERVAAGAPPLVWKDGDERAWLMRIRSGDIGGETAVAECQERIDRLRAAEASWSVRDEPDTAAMNEWLVDLRVDGLRRLQET